MSVGSHLSAEEAEVRSCNPPRSQIHTRRWFIYLATVALILGIYSYPALRYPAYWITAFGYVRVSRFDFERNEGLDFVLSPVSTTDEIVTDLNMLFDARHPVGN
jgi:hypothetical protein